MIKALNHKTNNNCIKLANQIHYKVTFSEIYVNNYVIEIDFNKKIKNINTTKNLKGDTNLCQQ